MSIERISRENQIPDQVNAAIVGVINDQRIRDEAIQLVAQDQALIKALEQIEAVREFLGNPEQILGSELTKHGEIAEHVEVGVRNARAALLQQEMPATFEGIGRTAAADYSIDSTFVQSKFINGISKNLDHVLKHMDKYADFGRDGSYYHIPKDTYETILRVKNGLPVDDLSERTKATILDKIKLIEEQSGGKAFETVVQPSTSDYAEVQQGKVFETLDKRDQELKNDNAKIKEEIVDQHKPSLSGAAEAAAIAGAVGGVLSFGTALYSKYKQGRNPFKGEMSIEDWKEVGVTTTKGAAGGAITGGAVYLLTNNASLPAPFAGAVVIAAKGVYSLLSDYNEGKITFDEFVDLGLIVCSESAIVGLATAAGQTLIPIPILGAVIGSLAGKLLTEIATGKSADIAKRMRKEMDEFLAKVDAEYQAIIKKIDAEFERLGKLTETAFNVQRNIELLSASIDLARAYGVAETEIIHNHSELDEFMLG